jgi:serine/threonine-protein kinase
MAGVREVLAERYELLELIGRGGMGVVHRAHDHVLDRVVAVKLLPLDRAQDPTAVARFEREALAAAALSHPNIVAVFDFGIDHETRFIVMEHLAGQSLADRLRERGPMPPGEAVDVARQVAAALAAAHEAGIVHRDIKPANVMLNAQGHVKVLDFGIARLTSGIALTQTATVIGSASYLAPELFAGAAADARSDIYALGCVLYELLAGRPPYTGELAAAIMHQHSSATPEPLRRLNPAVPVALDELVSSMLAKRPAERPSDAGAVVAALSALRVGGDEPTATMPLMADGAATVPSASDGAATVPLASDGAATVPLAVGGAATAPLAASSAATVPLSGRRPAGEAPTVGMPRRDAARGGATDGRRRALALIATAALAVALLVFVAVELAGGPSSAPAAHHGRKATGTTTTPVKQTQTQTNTTPTTSSSTSTSSTTGTSTTGAGTSTTPGSVASAVAAIGSLAAGDVQAGTIAAPAANQIVGDAQQIATASANGQGGPAIAGLVKLGTDIRNAAQHGQIDASAVPAFESAFAGLGTALEQAVSSTTATTPGPGQQQGGPHGGGQPPGQAKKHGGPADQNGQ